MNTREKSVVKRFYTGADVFPDNEFPLCVMPVVHPASFAIHAHSFIELVLVVSGQGIHQLTNSSTGKTFSGGILFGDVILLRPGDNHAFRCCRNLKLYNILFRPEIITSSNSNLWSLPGLAALAEGGSSQKLHCDAESKNRLETLAKKLKQELKLHLPGYQIAAESILTEILVVTGRLAPLPWLPNSSEEGDEKLFRQQLVNRAICLMEEKSEQGISVAELALSLRVSTSHLTRTFKAICGLTPSDYMLRFRLEKVKSMLLETDLPVENIALLNGFCDPSHLSRHFRRLEGCTPSEFRTTSQN